MRRIFTVPCRLVRGRRVAIEVADVDTSAMPTEPVRDGDMVASDAAAVVAAAATACHSTTPAHPDKSLTRARQATGCCMRSLLLPRHWPCPTTTAPGRSACAAAVAGVHVVAGCALPSGRLSVRPSSRPAVRPSLTASAGASTHPWAGRRTPWPRAVVVCACVRATACRCSCCRVIARPVRSTRWCVCVCARACAAAVALSHGK